MSTVFLLLQKIILVLDLIVLNFSIRNESYLLNIINFEPLRLYVATSVLLKICFDFSTATNTPNYVTKYIASL